MKFEDIENPIGELRRLKGAPLSVLLAICFAGQPVSSQWLESVTGYSDKPIKKATILLSELNYILHTKDRAWALANGAYQLPLIHSLSTGEFQSRKKSDLGSTTTTLIKKNGNQEEKVEVVGFNRLQSRKKSDFDACVEELKAFGIYQPTASKLADLPWITPEYIILHGLKAMNEKTQSGLLVYRMQHQDPAPEARIFYDDNGEIDHVSYDQCPYVKNEKTRKWEPWQGA